MGSYGSFGSKDYYVLRLCPHSAPLPEPLGIDHRLPTRLVGTLNRGLEEVSLLQNISTLEPLGSGRILFYVRSDIDLYRQIL